MPNGHTHLRNGSISQGNVVYCSVFQVACDTVATSIMFHGKRNQDVMFLIEKDVKDRLSLLFRDK